MSKRERYAAGTASLIFALSSAVILSIMNVLPAWLSIITLPTPLVYFIALITLIIASTGIIAFIISFLRSERKVNLNRFTGCITSIIIIIADLYLLGWVP